MKKYMSVILTLALCLGAFAGCGKKEEAAADRLAQILSRRLLCIIKQTRKEVLLCLIPIFLRSANMLCARG